MLDWYGLAKKVPLSGSGAYVGGPYRGCLHSTEGASIAGAVAAYHASGNLPHFTISWEGGVLLTYQHVPLTVASSALKHPSGTVDTNRLSCVQIEVVGFATQAAHWSTPLMDGLRALMVWIESQTGIKPQAPGFLPYPKSYGANNGVRMSADTWKKFSGWCGHMHVVNQDHGDPGDLDIGYLLQRSPASASIQPARPVLVPAPVHDFEEATIKQAMVTINLDDHGNGWVDFDPALGRDPLIIGVTQLGPSPPDESPGDPYWASQGNVNLSAQPHAGKMRVVARQGPAGGAVNVWVACA